MEASSEPSIACRPVGVIGLGALGAGMAGSLRRAGCDVHGCDGREGAAPAFATNGGTARPTPAELASRCEVVVSVVVNAAQIDAVLFDGDDASGGQGQVLSNCARVSHASSATSRLARSLLCRDVATQNAVKRPRNRKKLIGRSVLLPYRRMAGVAYVTSKYE